MSRIRDRDPVLFLTPGSGIPDRKNPDQGFEMNIPIHFSESLVTVFRAKNTLIRIRDLFWIWIQDQGWKKNRIWDKHPGSATLLGSRTFEHTHLKNNHVGPARYLLQEKRLEKLKLFTFLFYTISHPTGKIHVCITGTVLSTNLKGENFLLTRQWGRLRLKKHDVFLQVLTEKNSL